MKHDHDSALRAALKIALSGAVTGGALGAGAKFLTGGRTLGAISKSGGVGAALGGGIAGLSNLVGSAVEGPPEPGEEGSPYAERGLVGGGLAGAGIGALLGGLGAAGKIKAATAASPKILRALSRFAENELPLKNLITEKIAALGAKPSSAGIKRGAMIGGAALGIPAAFEGMDEGMYYDALMREIEEERKKRLHEEMVGYGGTY